MQRLLSSYAKLALTRGIAQNPPVVNKMHTSIEQAISCITPGSTIAIGGYSSFGAPNNLIKAIASKQKLNKLNLILAIVENDSVLDPLLQTNQLSSVTTSFVDPKSLLAEKYNKGEVQVTLEGMGTLVEKLRSAGMGVPAFYTRAGVGTLMEKGGMPVKLDKNGKACQFSQARLSRSFEGVPYLKQPTILCDFSLVKAMRADPLGNAIFNNTAMNTNIDVASAGKLCIVESDEVVDLGVMDGDDIQLSGVFVHRVVKAESKLSSSKTIEDIATNDTLKDKKLAIIEKAIKELSGRYVFLGRGLPRIMPLHDKAKRIRMPLFLTETGMLGAAYKSDFTNSNNSFRDGDGISMFPAKYGAVAKSSDLFAAVRGGHLNQIFVEGYEVSENGDLSNWSRGGSLEGPHSNMDLVHTKTPVIVLMQHCDAKGKCNLVKQCSLPLTGSHCVSKLITDMGVFRLSFGKFILKELNKGVTLNDIKKITPLELNIDNNLLNAN